MEELAAQFRQATDRYEAAQKDLKDMSNLNKVNTSFYHLISDKLLTIQLFNSLPLRLRAQILKSSLLVRLSRWNDFRRHIALRTKLQFAYHLTNRGYIGKLVFNHTASTLELKVRVPISVCISVFFPRLTRLACVCRSKQTTRRRRRAGTRTRAR